MDFMTTTTPWPVSKRGSYRAFRGFTLVEVMIGATFWLGGESWGVQDFRGFWGGDRSATTQWTEEDRIAALGNMVLGLRTILQEAKKQTIADLAGMPIEATFSLTFSLSSSESASVAASAAAARASLALSTMSTPSAASAPSKPSICPPTMRGIKHASESEWRVCMYMCSTCV